MKSSAIITARKRSLRRLCFHRCLSVHRGVCLSACWETPSSLPSRETPLPRRPPSRETPPCQGDPPAKETPPAGRHPPRGNPPAKDTPLPRRPPAKETPHQGDTPLPGRPPCQGDPPPGPHPGGKLRGIRSRPTAKGEIEGGQIQANSQGGN